jgi:hypothetical protein
VLPLHPSIVLPLSTIRGPWLTALWIRITLPLSGRQEAIAFKADSTAACPLQGLVRRCCIEEVLAIS